MDQSVHPVRAFRLSQTPKLPMKKLADRIGTSTANLSRIENGLQPVSEILLPKLLAETGIPAKQLRPDLAEMFAEAAE